MSELFTVGKMPILALRGLAVFPEQTLHFEVGRMKSVLALEEAMKGDQTLLLIPQRDIAVDDPDWSDLDPMGTVARIKQILRGPNETVRVLVTGLCRARIQQPLQAEPFLCGTVMSVLSVLAVNYTFNCCRFNFRADKMRFYDRLCSKRVDGADYT